MSRSIASKLNGYKVDGWYMTNYPNSNCWKGYYTSDDIKYDYKGYLENPLGAYAGVHEFLYFIDFSSGSTLYGDVNNYGPVTISQRGDVPQNNFPPDYSIVEFFFTFDPAVS